MRPIAYILALTFCCAAVVVAQGAEPLVVTKVEPYQFKMDGEPGIKVYAAVNTDCPDVWFKTALTNDLERAGWRIVGADSEECSVGRAWVIHISHEDEPDRAVQSWGDLVLAHNGSDWCVEECGRARVISFRVYPLKYGLNRRAAIKRLKAGGIEFHIAKERE